MQNTIKTTIVSIIDNEIRFSNFVSGSNVRIFPDEYDVTFFTNGLKRKFIDYCEGDRLNHHVSLSRYYKSIKPVIVSFGKNGNNKGHIVDSIDENKGYFIIMNKHWFVKGLTFNETIDMLGSDNFKSGLHLVVINGSYLFGTDDSTYKPSWSNEEDFDLISNNFWSVGVNSVFDR